MAKSTIEKIRIPLSKCLATSVILLMLLSQSKWTGSHWTPAIFLALAFICSGLACIGRIWCALHIAGYKNKVLVEQGPYSMTRNPLYFFSALGTLGVGLATLTLTIPLIMLLGFGLYYPLVIRDEEKRLAKRHPEQFVIYKARVPGFFPKPTLLKEPKSYKVRPRIFRRHLFSAIWFVWITALIAIMNFLAPKGMVPALFSLY